LTGTNTYSGGTTINGGTLALGSADALGSTGTISFAGGTLQFGASNTTDYSSRFSTAASQTYSLDTNGQNVTLASNLSSTGASLTKLGSGQLTLTGNNTYSGSTTVDAGTLRGNGNQSTAVGAVTVNAGTLGGTGTVGGAVDVSASGSINPGAATPGTLTVPSADLNPNGTLVIDINDAATQKADRLVVIGNLNLAGAKLSFNVTGTPTEASYLIASAGSITSNFGPGDITGLPAGYQLEQTATTVSLVKAGFGSWIGGFGLALGDQDPTDDPDSDGVDNLTEFALNGDPSNGSNNGLTAMLVQDASAPAGNELTLIAAVRDGAVFASGTGDVQTATLDGIVYAIEGSTDLVFPGSAVSVVGSGSNTAPAATGLPTLPGSSEWEYRTFKLNASEGLPGKGFLRVKVTAAP